MAKLIDYHSHADIEEHNRRYGHPADLSALPLAVRQAEMAARQAYVAAGLAPPPARHSMLSIIGVPEIGDATRASHCHVCGAETEHDQNLAAHALAGFEDALDATGRPIRLLVTHCAAHAPNRQERMPHCHPLVQTPECGLPEGQPGGFCEPVQREAELSGVLLPGFRQLARFSAWALAGMGLYLAANSALVFSRGQSKADMEGTTNQALAIQDTTNGHGFNNGKIDVRSGSAPVSADAADTGTLGISWLMPTTTQAFSASSAATPPVTTLTAITNVAAAASITAGYGRITTNGGAFPTVEDGTLSTTQRRIMFAVGTSASDMNFNTLTVTVSATCSLTSLTITHG